MEAFTRIFKATLYGLLTTAQAGAGLGIIVFLLSMILSKVSEQKQ